MYELLLEPCSILPVTSDALGLVAVNSAKAQFRKYVDALLELDNAVVHQLLLVIKGLEFLLQIGMDIFRLHGATLTFSRDASLLLRNQIC